MTRQPVLILSLLTSAVVVHAQQPLIPGDAGASEALTKIIESTRESGLPADPILAKVRYALLIAHAQPAKVVAVARDVAARLSVARVALQPGATAPDIVAGEGALSFKANREALHAIRVASGNQSVVVPLGVLAQLLATGVPLDRASETVVALIRHGATSQQLASLGNNVNEDVVHGAQAATALDIRVRGLTAVLAPAGVASGVAAPASASQPGAKKP